MTYLEDGRCSFSNNLSENAIRPFTVGRKNWLFCDSPDGAQASADVYTMVEIAKANGVNVYHYLTYLLEKCPNDSMSDIKSHCPFAYVLFIEFYDFFEVCDVASSAYLPHSGKSRLGCEAGAVMKFVFIPFVYCWRAGT